MSKLSIIRKSLEEDPEVVIAKVFERNYLPGRIGYWSHTMDFWVAPKNGLYTAGELQEFMLSLVPKGLGPTLIDNFSQHGEKSVLDFGKLYFDEQIGEEKVTRTCTLTDKELLNVSGFVDGKTTIEETQPYVRRIWVKPFPDEAFVRYALEERRRVMEGERGGDISLEHYVHPEVLKRHQSIVLQGSREQVSA